MTPLIFCPKIRQFFSKKVKTWFWRWKDSFVWRSRLTNFVCSTFFAFFGCSRQSNSALCVCQCTGILVLPRKISLFFRFSTEKQGRTKKKKSENPKLNLQGETFLESIKKRARCTIQNSSQKSAKIHSLGRQGQRPSSSSLDLLLSPLVELNSRQRFSRFTLKRKAKRGGSFQFYSHTCFGGAHNLDVLFFPFSPTVTLTFQFFKAIRYKISSFGKTPLAFLEFRKDASEEIWTKRQHFAKI